MCANVRDFFCRHIGIFHCAIHGESSSTHNRKLVLKRSAGSTDDELSKHNLLSHLETDSVGLGSLETQTLGVPQLPQLPKSSRKPRHILVQEIRDHHANEIE